ncbi:anti-sigma factor family protein [Streptomyces griseoviridis]|uniref:anti-sigma factor family protein n=1 Tax=Streptomyces griseoviridis TaxID=45398 RepID=UPI001677AB16|nr:zf-HC2 domain-containing protein [Streptomyces griseoviridis]GGS85762.1 membrane protein [Streptomyces griseoviridis]
MSGTRPKPEGHLAEQHLGDRLSALVDGELGHDARERVLAHVATCPKCKAEVDAQRRLKNVFAKAAGPAPSESLLARLQGLPGGDGPPAGGDALPGFPDLAGRFGDGTTAAGGTAGVFGVRRGGRFAFDYVPSRPPASSVLTPATPGRGFRVHDVGRPDSDRSASRGLRFAFAAAGAVSLAAVALGGVTAGTPDSTAEARGGAGTGSNVTPARTQGAGSATAPDTQRRRSLTPLLGQAAGQAAPGDSPAVSASVSAPLLPGLPVPSAGPDDRAVQALTAPVMAGAVAMSPLIRPFEAVPPVTLTSWATVAEVTAPGLLAGPAPDPAPAPATAPSATPAASSFPSVP